MTAAEHELHVVQSALVIRPGDRVLLTVGPGYTDKEIRALQQRCAEVYPGVQFNVAAGVTGLVRVEGT